MKPLYERLLIGWAGGRPEISADEYRQLADLLFESTRSEGRQGSMKTYMSALEYRLLVALEGGSKAEHAKNVAERFDYADPKQVTKNEKRWRTSIDDLLNDPTYDRPAALTAIKELRESEHWGHN